MTTRWQRFKESCVEFDERVGGWMVEHPYATKAMMIGSTYAGLAAWFLHSAGDAAAAAAGSVDLHFGHHVNPENIMVYGHDSVMPHSMAVDAKVTSDGDIVNINVPDYKHDRYEEYDIYGELPA